MNENVVLLFTVKYFLLFKYKNKRITFDHEDIVVEIGIIINPILLKKVILINIFNKTENIEKQKGTFVLCLANKKDEKIFINAKAGTPNAKQKRAFEEFSTLLTSKEPQPNKLEVISLGATNNANIAGKLKNKLSSKDLS